MVLMTGKTREHSTDVFIPEIKLKTETSRHKCPICQKTMGIDVMVIQFVGSASYGGSWRLAHLDCWLVKYASGMIMSKRFDDIEKLRKELFLEEV